MTVAVITAATLAWADVVLFAAAGLAALAMGAHIAGLAVWLHRRSKARDHSDQYYAGL